MYTGQSEWRAGGVGALSVSPYKAVHRCTQDSQNGGRVVWGPYRSHRIRPFRRRHQHGVILMAFLIVDQTRNQRLSLVSWQEIGQIAQGVGHNSS